MRWNELASENCAMARCMAVIGDQWTFMILRDCFLGVTRFDDFKNNLGIGRTLLSARLNKLVDEDVLEKIAYQDHPPRYDYKLSEKGLDLYGAIMHLVAWGDKYYFKEGGPIKHVHKTCGHTFKPELHCSECHKEIAARDVTINADGLTKTSRS